ncbi:MAG: hypothetical protein IJY39_11735 [Clostridia bacterium]|nr:hypothetical protein [Clostridia bacterium]
MKRKSVSILSLLLAMLMLIGMFTACNTTDTPSDNTDSDSSSSQTELSTESDSATEEETEEDTTPKLEGANAQLIENAERLANGVQSYYADPDRTSYTIENKNMSLDYVLTGSENQMVTAIKNTKGESYIEDTMDVFVKMKDGTTYYASETDEQTRVNIYRYGYYYYDVHLLEQDFEKGTTVEKETDIPITDFTSYKHTTKPKFENGELKVTITNQVDPQVYAATSFKANEYNNLQVTVKSDTVVTLTVYIVAGAQKYHNNKQSTVVEIINDGEWHTVNIPLSEANFPDYTGDVTSIRLDLGGVVGTDFYLKDVKIQKVSHDAVPLTLDRTFHTFPDKLHQELHIVAYEDTSDIEAIGMTTSIKADTVDKLIVKDKNGLHQSLDSVDWASAEYVGFDIKNVGIFGYILPYDNESGAIEVTLEGGNYLITQTDCPEGGVIKAPIQNTFNDFRMGHRLYTDSSHNFEKFLNEAYCERNPLDEDNIVIDASKMKRGAKFKEYDALRGVYHFTIKGASGFSDPYYNNQNLHYNASFSITGDDHDRMIYIMTYTSSGCLECAVLLDENNMMLPVPLEVSKNFSEQEEPIYNCGDATYGETFFPMVIKAGERNYITVLNFYQNWGNFPLKQLSSIGYYMPYYHLSTGVTETNCISNWYNRGKNLWTLPDHRSMSMPASSDLKNMYPAYGNQPQRPNAGYHYFLQYTDAAGNYIASDYLDNIISSAGPTYADITMNYLSDDGKIKVSYRHIEMPQVDENRTYYEIKYEVLDTVEIANFMKDFSFYTMTGFVNYTKVGYLDENNESKIKSVNPKDKPLPYVLGDSCPYFSLFHLPSTSVYTNLAFLIYDSEFIIGGKQVDENFVIIDQNYAVRLSLNIDGKVTLQKGDSFTINAIILPWGGGWVLDDGTQYHNTTDKNVQLVRENTLLNPFKATPVENCEAVESVFLPRVRSTDGKSATFTLSGGYDCDPSSADTINMTVRVDGFNSLTKLKLEELIDGKWVSIELSSVNSPDTKGNTADYDGYAVHYDGDGTYSYSFVMTITDGTPRTVRVSAE